VFGPQQKHAQGCDNSWQKKIHINILFRLNIQNKISGSHGGDLWDATQAVC